MTHSPNPSQPRTRVILLGDQETAAHRHELAEDAARKGCVIADVFAFPSGAAVDADDLTEVDAVVTALGRAITARMDIWVPFPGSDFIREQHLRRLSLVLQRHGRNLRLIRDLMPAPATGGMNEIDFALRREVQAVDALDNAALAAEGAESLSREIERALAGARTPPSPRRVPAGGTEPGGPRESMPPALPTPNVPWAQRKTMLERYARWLVYGCGVTQAATARVLNSAGQRTATGRRWQPGTVSRLLNDNYDGEAKARRAPQDQARSLER